MAETSGETVNNDDVSMHHVVNFVGGQGSYVQ